jgi:4-hydroxy-tetrahydrodipicolinate reductase
MSSRIALIGATGRMGKEILNVSQEFLDLPISHAVVSASSKMIGQDTCLPSLKFSSIESITPTMDGIIDFSSCEALEQVCKVARKYKVPLLIGTTGHTDAQINEIQELAEHIPVLVASNTSLGIALITELATRAKQILGSGFDIEITEIHHREKKDVPSGTAKSLAYSLAAQNKDIITYNRVGKREHGSIGVSSLRGGHVFGEHTVHFLGNGERIEITHTAENREVFARGALRLFKVLLGKNQGLYSVADLISCLTP